MRETTPKNTDRNSDNHEYQRELAYRFATGGCSADEEHEVKRLLSNDPAFKKMVVSEVEFEALLKLSGDFSSEGSAWSCKEVQEQGDAWRNQTLDDSSDLSITHHLAICQECRSSFEAKHQRELTPKPALSKSALLTIGASILLLAAGMGLGTWLSAVRNTTKLDASSPTLQRVHQQIAPTRHLRTLMVALPNDAQSISEACLSIGIADDGVADAAKSLLGKEWETVVSDAIESNPGLSAFGEANGLSNLSENARLEAHFLLACLLDPRVDDEAKAMLLQPLSRLTADSTLPLCIELLSTTHSEFMFERTLASWSRHIGKGAIDQDLLNEFTDRAYMMKWGGSLWTLMGIAFRQGLTVSEDLAHQVIESREPHLDLPREKLVTELLRRKGSKAETLERLHRCVSSLQEPLSQVRLLVIIAQETGDDKAIRALRTFTKHANSAVRRRVERFLSAPAPTKN